LLSLNKSEAVLRSIIDHYILSGKPYLLMKHKVSAQLLTICQSLVLLSGCGQRGDPQIIAKTTASPRSLSLAMYFYQVMRYTWSLPDRVLHNLHNRVDWFNTTKGPGRTYYICHQPVRQAVHLEGLAWHDDTNGQCRFKPSCASNTQHCWETWEWWDSEGSDRKRKAKVAISPTTPPSTSHERLSRRQPRSRQSLKQTPLYQSQIRLLCHYMAWSRRTSRKSVKSHTVIVIDLSRLGSSSSARRLNSHVLPGLHA